jgi:hypothetical protein
VDGTDARSPEALASLAWDAFIRGQITEAARLASRASSAAASLTRQSRQQVEVVCVAIAGDAARARDLAAEHLVEFPDDVLVRKVQRACETP